MQREFISYLNEISKKWRKKWEEAKLFEAEVSDKPKFFITAAFPYPNSPMHLGHSRTYSITDAYARFKRMQGFNVLFPMGFHYTGTPIIAMAEKVKIANEILEKVKEKEDPVAFLRAVWESARACSKETGRKLGDCFEEALNSQLERLGLGKVSKTQAEAVMQTALFLFMFDLPYEDIVKLTDPLAMADYFASITEESMKEMGYMIDWRRKFRTIDPDFQKFIVWQFTVLQKLGYVEKGTHPVAWDPVYNTPVSQHDTMGDVEPEIEDYDVILFKLKDEDLYLPAATLRAETVFGVTNVWLNPNVEYKVVEVEGKKWLLSPKAAYKIKYQKDEVKEVGVVKGSELLKKLAVNPATGDEVPILPATFVDPNVATGVVMSVPAHAPFDYVALKDLEKDPEYSEMVKNIEIIPVIEVPGMDEPTAVAIVKKMGIKSQEEKEKLEEATKEVYALEYRKGRMREDVLERAEKLGGKPLVGALKVLMAKKPVPEARELTANWLSAFGRGDKFYEIKNGPVYSRFGNEVVAKILKDQWFLNYGDPQWKALARKLLAQMRIVPEKFRKDFEETIEWLQRRACARTRGLGTPLPWDPKWIIESLSDSTIYMAFYTVDHILRSAKVDPEKLQPEVWDYILLGKGEVEKIAEKYGIDEEVLEKARESFSYWYPLDSRHSGKDLIKNHLTFFIFNHAAIFPEDLWPRQIVVNGFVTLQGQKMSKSLGNIIPLYKATRIYSPDVIRLGLLYGAELGSDADFNEQVVDRILENLKEIKEIVEMVKEFGEVEKPQELHVLDSWLLSSFIHDVDEVTQAMEDLRTRSASNTIYFILLNKIKEYLKDVKASGREDDQSVKWVLKYIVDRWVRMMVPFTPYFAEEMWHLLGHEGFVLNEPWPIAERELVDLIAIASKEYVDTLIEDIKEIIRVAKIENPKRVRIVVAPKEAQEMLRLAVKLAKEGKGMREFMAEGVKIYGKRAAKDLKRIFSLYQSLSESLREAVLTGEFDEKEVLEKYKQYLQSKLGLEVDVEEYKPEDKKKPMPLKPAIYVE
ncbi:leucyl-tRNA synthetase [Ignicoccus pacificus DSM 13166]|uniref:Leucine--tRNA ligase n=1 Tax=Ignicoccus pacificus DSM 13166 TaxID=940294 RepID=A0A977PJM8_9CREN|nr:leucyl-tRNA synthetase [Ignicoccus pacificus DSM 13166]